VKILRIDLDQRSWVVEERRDGAGEAFPASGGRLLTSEILDAEVDPGCDPLGADNKLVVTTGPLAGWNISCGGRLSVGAKSPLTGGIKEANSGGNAADALAGLGYRAVVLSGALLSGAPGLVIIEDDGVRFEDATSYRGQRLEDMAAQLRQSFEDYAYISIGPAGEMLLPTAAVAVSDVRGDPFRFAARGGLGAVLGSKGVKAILIQQAARPRPKSGSEFRRAVGEFHRAVSSNPRVDVLRKFGTASTVMMVQSLGGLPTRNFREGEFEHAEEIAGEALYDLTVSRGGEGNPTERCMAACIIQCSNVYPDAEGRRLVAPIEYETLIMCGSNLGISDPDIIARINRECNELGLDTIEIGAALGVAAEAGLWEFGDGQRAIELVQEIGQGTVVGRLLGQGCETVGQVLGVRRIPAAKGQALSAYDPRGVKGVGVTFATTPMGGDHTAGLTLFAPLDHHKAEGQIEASRSAQITRAAYDALGLCVFLLGSTGSRPELLTGILNAAYGLELEPDYIAKLGRHVVEQERDFNDGAGLTGAMDRLPDFFYNEALAPHGSVFDISHEELRQVWGDE
jgi:aldehyde:ferredoxin oxidoreductase